MWADAVIFGSPTRFGSPASQFRTFIDSLGGLWTQGKLADKVYAGFTSSQTAHGGQETTLLSLYISLMHFGGIIVPPGYTDGLKFADGNPYGVSHITGPDNQNAIDDATAAAWSPSPTASRPGDFGRRDALSATNQPKSSETAQAVSVIGCTDSITD